MKLIDSSYEIIEPKSYDLGSVFKHIELCGSMIKMKTLYLNILG